ncbi:MAG: 3'-5' exonuclease [Bacteroidota bacterium]
MWEGLNAVDKSGLNTRVINKIRAFTTMIKSFGVVAKNVDAHEAAAHIAKESGILKSLHGNPETLDRWENVQELLNAAQAFAEDPDVDDTSLESFLADISLFTDADADSEIDDFVTLMTVHSAKGLEFKSVFLVGMEENIFPSGMALETRADLEEERRLFYVAITRAEKKLTMSHAKSRYRFGQMQFNEPSRFLDEIDEKYLSRPKPASDNWGAFAPRRAAVEPPKKRDTSRLTPMSKATRRPTTQKANFKAANPADIVPGLQVEHQKFGKGKVLQVEGAGPGKKATVFFEGKGQRVLLLKYAKLQIVG